VEEVVLAEPPHDSPRVDHRERHRPAAGAGIALGRADARGAEADLVDVGGVQDGPSRGLAQRRVDPADQVGEAAGGGRIDPADQRGEAGVGRGVARALAAPGQGSQGDGDEQPRWPDRAAFRSGRGDSLVSQAMSEASRPDSLARSGAVAIGVARIGIGVAAFAFTRPALRALGFGDPSPAAVALARLAGGRDVALGAHAISVRDDRDRLREASVLAALVDAGDTVAFLAALASPGFRRMAVLNAPAGATGAVAGAWVASRLRP
jgi:hypothetical protein